MNLGASADTADSAQPPAVPAAGPPGDLTSAEAAARLARDGQNVLPATRTAASPRSFTATWWPDRRGPVWSVWAGISRFAVRWSLAIGSAAGAHPHPPCSPATTPTTGSPRTTGNNRSARAVPWWFQWFWPMRPLRWQKSSLRVWD
jgi:hypothetical protein